MSVEKGFAAPRLIQAVGLLAFLTLTAGCATIASGSRQQVHFDSFPQGATAVVDGQRIQTPADVNLSRKHTYDVVFEKPGYVSARRRISHKTNMATYGNFLIGGLVGIVIDMSTGATYDLDPDILSVNLIEDPEYTGEPEAQHPPTEPGVAGEPAGAGDEGGGGAGSEKNP